MSDPTEPGLSNLSPEEVERRIPTLQLIDDARTRAVTIRLTQTAPKYFWTVPASKSGYHHPECQKERGLWAHTLMLSSVIDRLGDSYVEQGLLSREQIDYAHAAAILHDQRKHGDPDSPAEKSVRDHDLLMAEIVDESPLHEDVANAVSAHNGPWYRGNDPETHVDMLVHTADMVASTPSITPGIQGPIPEELEGLELEEVDLR